VHRLTQGVLKACSSSNQERSPSAQVKAAATQVWTELARMRLESDFGGRKPIIN